MRKPQLGLIPKKIYDEQKNAERLYDVCKAIQRYFNAGEKIPVEWIKEYNQLIEKVQK